MDWHSTSPLCTVNDATPGHSIPTKAEESVNAEPGSTWIAWTESTPFPFDKNNCTKSKQCTSWNFSGEAWPCRRWNSIVSLWKRQWKQHENMTCLGQLHLWENFEVADAAQRGGHTMPELHWNNKTQLIQMKSKWNESTHVPNFRASHWHRWSHQSPGEFQDDLLLLTTLLGMWLRDFPRSTANRGRFPESKASKLLQSSTDHDDVCPCQPLSLSPQKLFANRRFDLASREVKKHASIC